MELPISDVHCVDEKLLDAPSPGGAETAEGRPVREARRNRAAFVPLYRAYVTPLYRYLAQHAGRPEDAENLVAATFSKALASLDRYQEQGSFAAWLFSIARHTLHEFQRRSHAQIDVELAAATAPP